MIDRLLDQRIEHLEFRVQSLEKAVLAMAENLARLEHFFNAGAVRLMDTLFEEEESKR